MKHFESTLTNITEQVWAAKGANDAKNIIISYLDTTNVKDKKKMILDVESLNTLTAVQRYFANALLAFEGMRVGVKKD